MRDTGAIWALGTMSGTSLDGVDAAMVLTDGHEVLEFGKSAYRGYSNDERQVISKATGKTDGLEVKAASEIIELAHAEVLSDFQNAEVIGFHGQTLWHDPSNKITFQAGDGQILAQAMSCPVVWDFRSIDVQLGGQGAPLAPFFHFALAKRAKLTEPVVFLNIGGVANMTWLDPQFARAEDDGACLAFDTGPGNAIMDDLMMERTGQPFDKDGKLAGQGEIDELVLNELLNEPRYFARVPPKSLDRNQFSHWSGLVDELNDADAMATLAAGTAGSILAGLNHCPTPPTKIIVSGGGRKNETLMGLLAGLVSCDVLPAESLGFDGDMLEAQAFGYLAVRVARGLPTSSPSTTGVATPVGGGKISKPSE